MKELINIYCDTILRQASSIQKGLDDLNKDIDRCDPGAKALYEAFREPANTSKTQQHNQVAQCYIQGLFSRSFIPSVIGSSLNGSKLQDEPKVSWDDTAVVLCYEGNFKDNATITTNNDETKALDQREKALCTKEIRITASQIQVTLESGLTFSLSSDKTDYQGLDKLKEKLHELYGSFMGYEQQMNTGAPASSTPIKAPKPLLAGDKALIACAAFTVLAIGAGIATGIVPTLSYLMIAALVLTAGAIVSAVTGASLQSRFFSCSGNTSNDNPHPKQ